MKNGVSTEHFEHSLKLFEFRPDTAKAIYVKWQQRNTSLAEALLSRTLATNKLLDMDWSFGVTASSDDADQVGKTFLQVKMKIDAGDEGVRDIFFELTLEQFYTFLAQMEKCKSFIDLISA